MVYRFRISSNLKFDSLRIYRRRNGVVQSLTEECLQPAVREFSDPYWKEGDEYCHVLFENDDEVFRSKWSEVDVSPETCLRLTELLHPEDRSGLPPDNSLVAVIHQTLNPNTWWQSTRSWVSRLNDQTITLNDDLFLPVGQEPFNYSDLEIGNIYFMPKQMFDWLEYLSFQVEKPFYNYPETIPKAYSINEMLMALKTAVDTYNGAQPCTRFGFMYGKTFDFYPFPDTERGLIIELAAIELIKANVINWLELKFDYSEGVDVSITKYDDYTAYLDSLRGDMIEKIDRTKTKFLGRGFYNGSKFGFAPPFNMGSTLTSLGNFFPLLTVLRDTPGARSGVFNTFGNTTTV